MQNQMPSMPSMPSMPKQESSSVGESQVSSQAPFTEDSVEKSIESNVELNTPSHDDGEDQVGPGPQIHSSLQPPASEVKVPAARQRGIKVVATRKGFYNQMRYKEGDQFIIRSEDEFGEWMKCVDPSMEQKRLEFFKQKSLRQKKEK